jgi:predicted Rdx family selenoprotein
MRKGEAEMLKSQVLAKCEHDVKAEIHNADLFPQKESGNFTVPAFTVTFDCERCRDWSAGFNAANANSANVRATIDPDRNKSDATRPV